MRKDDNDIVRWGLHLLDIPYRSSSGRNGSSGCNHHHQHNSSSSVFCAAHASTENDEAIAIRLQEQLYLDDQTSPVKSKDPEIGDFFECKEHGGSYGDCDADSDVCEECAAEDKEEMSRCCMGNSGSSSKPASNTVSSYDQNSNENDEAIAVVLSEELAQLDGEVGKRLTHMESIPHVPRINGEIPSADAATLDHQRLLERLHVYGLTEHKIPGDGNCQFRALSDQFYRTPDHHMFVRKEIIKQLKQCPEPYEGYVPMRFSDYLKKMAKNGEWGDHVTLQAAADTYGMKICLITSFRDTCIIDIVPKQPKSERVIFLSFWAEVHYNSVYPEGEIPVSYQVRKKRHWFSFFG